MIDFLSLTSKFRARMGKALTGDEKDKMPLTVVGGRYCATWLSYLMQFHPLLDQQFHIGPRVLVNLVGHAA
jgi:hypothetical protein